MVLAAISVNTPVDGVSTLRTGARTPILCFDEGLLPVLGDTLSGALRIAIDARAWSGLAGGVETVIIGLAAGLSRLTDGNEEYLFLATPEDAWLRPYVSGPARIIRIGKPRGRVAQFRRVAADRAPTLRTAWRWLSRFDRRVSGPTWSDGSVEGLRADIVHLPIQNAFLTDIPTIYHPHDLQHVHLPQYFSAKERRRRDMHYRIHCTRAAMVAVTSTWVRSDLIDHFGLAESRVRVVEWAPILTEYPEPTANDTDRLRTEHALPDRFVMYPAQTWPHKNHELLFDAIARLRRTEGLDVPTVLTGHETDHAITLRRRARRLGISDLIHWLGFVSPAELHALYRIATVVAIPSRFEAASGPLWEAFAAGTAAACSDVTSLPMQAGDAALLFSPDDAGGFAEAIRSLWTDPRLRSELSAKGRARIASLTWDHTARKFRAHYRRLAGRALSLDDETLIAEAPRL